MKTLVRTRLNPVSSRDQQAVALWIESALGGDPILISGRTGLGIDVISRSIEMVDGLAGEPARAGCEPELRAARDRLVEGLIAAIISHESKAVFFDHCAQVADHFEVAIGEAWEGLLKFYDGGELVRLILGQCHEAMVNVFPDRESEIDELYCDLDWLVESWQSWEP